MSKKSFLMGCNLILCILSIIFSTHSFAYGHLMRLNEEKVTDAYLIHKIVTGMDINFCVKTGVPSFNKNKISLETSMSINLWLNAAEPLLEEYGIKRSMVNEVECTVKTVDGRSIFNPIVDLEIEVTNGSFYPGAAAYCRQLLENGKSAYFSYIRIVSDSIKWNDIFKLVGIDNLSDNEKEKFLQYISVDYPLTVSNFASKYNLPSKDVYWTTYKTLIHEIGHTLGLVDTYNPNFERQSDPNYRTEGEQESSVMKDMNYFYLTNDDIEGIHSLVRRFINLSSEFL